MHELITVHSFSINDRDYQPPAVAARLGSRGWLSSDAPKLRNKHKWANGRVASDHGSLDGGSAGLATE